MRTNRLLLLRKELRKDFNNYLEMTDGITTIGGDVGNFAVELLNSLQEEYENMKGFYEFKRKLNRSIELIKKIKNNPKLKKKYEVIYNQALVLLVSGFELFLSNTLKRLINEVPERISWKEGKKIGIELNLLEYYSTIGDLVVRSLKGDPNFQDLNSTLRFLKNCLDIDIARGLKEREQEMIMLYQAIRHIIIHNSAKIDADFLKQIRNTRFFEKYKKLEGKRFAFDKKSYVQAKNLFSKIVDLVLGQL